MFIVDTLESYEKALKFIEENETLAYDTETTGLDFHSDRVIGFGVSNRLSGFYVPIYTFEQRNNRLGNRPAAGLWANNILLALQSKKLLMFNASFDYRMTKFNFQINLLDSLHADVLLMKHTCDEEFPLDLKGISKKLWGHDVTKEKEEMQLSIKSNGGSATEYYKASEETLSKYCVQDCLLTFKLYDFYSKELRRQGLEDFYYVQEVLPLYKEVTIPMEEQGLAVDLPQMHSALEDISNDLKVLEASIQSAIEPHLGVFEAWFLNKDYSPTTKTGKPSAWTKKYASAKEAFFATGAPYMFNLLSKFHLKKLFFDTLHETPLNKTPTGLPQVDEDFIESLGTKYPWCLELIEYNKLVKIKSTYIERFLSEVHNGRFYPSFMQHRTVSGRLAGDLQQLPRPLEDGQASATVIKHTNRIRSFFISDPGCKLCSADYEQLEPTIFAHTSGDPALQRIFNTGLDFYSEVAISTEGLQGVSSDKSAPTYLGKVNKAARQKAKAYALGIAYGMTGYKLQFEIGVSHEEAEELVKRYLRAFPKLTSWIHTSHDAVRFRGVVATESGRLRRMPRAVKLHAEYGARLLDSLQVWKDYNDDSIKYEEVKALRREMRNLLNNAVNFQVQGLAASIVNKASIVIARRLKELELKSHIVMQVHDEIVLNVPDTEADAVASLVKYVMENITKLDVPLRTTPQFGNNFKECK